MPGPSTLRVPILDLPGSEREARRSARANVDEVLVAPVVVRPVGPETES